MRSAVIALACAALLACGGEPPASKVLDLATTTSVRDSGLLDELLPVFQRESGIEVRLIAVGSGEALRLGSKGDVDAVLSHAPEDELALVAQGGLVDRRPVMKNHFLLAGPLDDPAGVRGAAGAAEGLARIAAANAPYASRADESGTHKREQALLRAAGLDPSATWGRVIRTGSGMGATLSVADERGAYVLCDVGTFLAFAKRIELVPLTRPDDPALENLYAVSRPNPERHPDGHLNVSGATRFADFLVAPETQRRIAAFGGAPEAGALFQPLALPAGEASPP